MIFANPNSKPPARIERWALKLMNYDFEIVHKPGNSNIADYMSRQPAKRKEDDQDYNERETESHINMITT